ncbi:phosphoprotein associated with glycosphingolipid-enriched microdomains 1 [Osmerus mordax]|uniref:phosphoprotein associated with glycosphingolipid-enriched microdomains 1 n=1 Tax=Osmerus mordax TaxID=8014 RepID=UPI00351065AE
MAPVLSALWGPEGAGSGVARATSLGSEQLVLVGTLTVISAFVLLSVLLLLCAGCQGQKKASPHPTNGDHETLMNGVSEKEAVSQSVDSPGTDLVVSSSHNGPLTSGTVLTDTQDTSPHPSEEMLSSQSELRSSKCPQDRELPSIPPNSALEGMIGGSGDEPPATGDGTYEVVKEVVSASRDVSVEDSLYETVKELKEHPPPPFLNGTPHPHHHPPASALLNGLSPGTPERGPLCAGVEYASVDLNKKSRYSADLEARRSASPASSVAGLASSPGEEPEEEERPPPVPDKVLDENDNQTGVSAPREGLPLHNGEVHLPMSPSPDLDRLAMENELYSSVDKRCGVEEPENDYSSIGELKGMVSASSSSHLYATVRDIYPPDGAQGPVAPPTPNRSDPAYETIRIPKTGDGEECSGGAILEQTAVEHDYESVAELGLNRETSRL